MNSPLIKKTKARCIPHPIQSTPISDLFMQGNKYFSRSNSDNILCNLIIILHSIPYLLVIISKLLTFDN